MSLTGAVAGPLARALMVAGIVAGEDGGMPVKPRAADSLPYDILEFYPDATLVIDNEGKVIAWNKAMEEMTGVRAEEVVGKGDYEYALAFYGCRRPILIDLLDLPIDHVRERYSEVRISNGKLEAMTESVRLRGNEVVLWGVTSKLYGPGGKAVGAIESIRDVTPQVRMERELQKAREDLERRVEDRTFELAKARGVLQATLETVPLGVVLADADTGLITYATKGATDIFHSDMAGIDICGPGRPYRLLKPDGTPLATEERPLYRSLFHGEHISAEEIQIEREDGSVVTTLVSGAPVRDDNGYIVSVVVSVLDITERKRIESALRESEERYRTLAEEAQDYIYIIDRDLTVRYINTYGSGEISIPREDIIGSFLGDLFPPGTFDHMRASILGVIRTGAPRSMESPIEIAGAELWLDTRLIPLKRDGVVHAVMGISRDITERKRAEDALRESEEKFRVLAETSASAIFIYQDDRLQYVNPVLEHITGYGKAELHGMGYWGFIHPDEREMVRRRGVDRLAGLPVPSRYEVRIQTKSGEVRWLDIAAAVIDYKGLPAGLMTAFDITERKHAEEALIDAKQQAELYLDLMGHDINNMNQIALGYLEMAEETGDEKTASVVARALEILKSSTALINNLRKIQRIKGGAVELEETDLGAILAQVRDDYAAMPGRQIDIVLHTPPGCVVMANPLLKDVFSNIVGNAVKHSAGSLQIDIRVERTAFHGRECYRVSVEDNGPGIPDSTKGSIFHRFTRGKTEARGHGLGLYLVRTLVEEFGGRVRVEDRIPGDYSQGCRFVVFLPAAVP